MININSDNNVTIYNLDGTQSKEQTLRQLVNSKSYYLSLEAVQTAFFNNIAKLTNDKDAKSSYSLYATFELTNVTDTSG